MANTYDITVKLQAIADAITQGGGGGGGTTVIANPSGTPTDTLNTIQIASTIYDIAGGGGQGFTLTNLFTEQGTPALNTKTLSDSVLNYDAIYVEGMFNGEALMGNILLKETFENKLGNVYIGLLTFSSSYIGLTLASTATSFATYGGGGVNGITRIEGITFGSGGGGASSADNVSYDNTQSGLTATNVQDAIDENADDISTLNRKLIKRGTPINATTNANGNVDLGIKVSEKIIISAWIYCQTAHCRCILWANSATEPTWQITAVNNGTMAQNGNLAVTINYVYIDAI